MSTPRALLGAAGEEAAARHLVAQGYRVVAKNHRCRRGEVDLVVEKGEVLAFVEVRTRSSALFGGPAASVGFHKQRRVIAAARDFLAHWRGPERAVRFDVVAIAPGPEGEELSHLPGAFDAQGY